MFEKPSLDTLKHYGVKRKSGRYPWGSGEDPIQGSRDFLNSYRNLKSQGDSDVVISTKMGMNTRQLREKRSYAIAEETSYNTGQARKMSEAGLSNVAIGSKLGVSEATVRNYLSTKTPAEKVKKVQLDNIEDAITSGVSKTGYLDVGVGVERQLGVSRTKFNTVVNKLAESDDYHLHEVQVQRLSDKTGSKWTTVKVLSTDPDIKSVSKNKHNIRPLDSWSEDGGLSITKQYPPHMLPLDRIKIRYDEEGGTAKDGLIELRPGTKDLDLGRSKYAQVRIGAGDGLYLKGMVAYGDPKDFPKGVDIIFNTNKNQGTPPEKVFKPMKMEHAESGDPSAMFGSSVIRQKGALNIVNEQGDWDTWSGKMSSQFLSKQSTSLIKDRLDDTYNGLRHEYDEINGMTNPVVKKFLMDKYIEGLDSKAKHLKAKGLKDTKSHVLMPFPNMKPNEIYAPMYKDGDRVVLVRHPHGGIFEIPDLVVNNKHEIARRMLGTDAPDAVGIHPSVAEKLSGADFDGDTALVIPNNHGMIKTSRTLKELKNFDPKMYKVDHDTITPRYKQTMMGIVSNLITDMTIKGASEAELARAVKHSMVVIDAEKHKLDYKQSARDNGISALIKKYQTHINPETGKQSRGASTLIARSKQKIDISQHVEAKKLAEDKINKNTGKLIKKGLTPEEIAIKLKISVDTVKGYLYEGKTFNPDKYTSGTAREQLYLDYIHGIINTKNEAIDTSSKIPRPEYSKEAAKLYAPEIASLNAKLNTALLNSPRERQAQIMTNHMFYAEFHKGMEPDQIEKLKSRSLAKARVMTGAKKDQINITDREWEAIQSRAISNTKLLDILNNANMDRVRELASPRESKLSTAKATQALTLLNKGYTYAQVAEKMGVSTSVIMNELGLRKKKGVDDNE